MTDDQIRIAIAEWCGWKFIVSHDVMGKAVPDRWIKDEMEYFEDHPFPDYPNDLNAVHEAEKSLDRFQVSEYGIELCRVMKLPDINGEICWGSLVMATARQRCEALLKTIGKWKQ